MQVLTYFRSNRGATANYGKCYRASLRVDTFLTESAVNSLVGNGIVKKQQMRWSLHDAHMLMQIRATNLNCELRKIADTVPAARVKRPFSIQAQTRPFCAPPDPRQITRIYRERVAQDGPPMRRRQKRLQHMRESRKATCNLEDFLNCRTSQFPSRPVTTSLS